MNEEAPTAHAAAATLDERTYRNEYYKNRDSWGVEQKVASKRQVFSVGGMGLGKTKQGLRKIVDKAIEKMEKGASEEETKAWAQAEACK